MVKKAETCAFDFLLQTNEDLEEQFDALMDHTHFCVQAVSGTLCVKRGIRTFEFNEDRSNEMHTIETNSLIAAGQMHIKTPGTHKKRCAFYGYKMKMITS